MACTKSSSNTKASGSIDLDTDCARLIGILAVFAGVPALNQLLDGVFQFVFGRSSVGKVSPPTST